MTQRLHTMIHGPSCLAVLFCLSQAASELEMFFSLESQLFRTQDSTTATYFVSQGSPQEVCLLIVYIL